MNKSILFLMFVCGISKSNSQTFNCGDSLLDTRDGQKYATVLIGSDCWFKQNLNYGTMVTSYTSSTIHSDQSNNNIPEKYAQHNTASNLSIYGGLYEWAELMNYATTSGGQGLCPSGWHVSTDAEWSSLFAAAGVTMVTVTEGKGGNRLKKTTEGFGPGVGTDNVGFSAKLGGDRDAFGIFYGMGNRGIFWTSTLPSPGQAYNYHLWGGKDTIQKFTTGTTATAFACRCVKNTGSSGIKESGHNNRKMIIYPNPTSNYVTILLENLNSEIPFFITDISGKVVLSGNLSSKGSTIDVSSLSNGVYVVKCKSLRDEKLIIYGK